MNTGKHNKNFHQEYLDLVAKIRREQLLSEMMRKDELDGLYDDLPNNAGSYDLKMNPLYKTKPHWI